ncbi:uncharacterized protein LOC141842010 isoform X1 [Curcuma longa]|uniref:uncharacterized protein LOC141842010 isoform X1 n=1 Tax=Curcuma longa TaxID=136217 RepID=UPI003D9E7F4F
MFPSAEELRVALTLLELADLILERRHPRPPLDSLRWAGRKPRSVASRRRRPLQASSPPPPLVGNGNEREAAAAAAASSPTTPLSFQESGGSEEADARPDLGAERRKRSREVSLPLCEEGVLLTEPGPEHGKRRWKLIAREDRKSPSNTSSSIFSYQSHQATKQREVVSIGGGGVADPMAVDHHPWPAAFSAWVQPTGGDGHRGRQQQSSRAAVGLPDLNVSPTEEEEQLLQQQQQRDRVLGLQQRQQQLMAYRAATSLARKRRVQIQREKRSSLLPYNSK